jgi:hypothetical protein
MAEFTLNSVTYDTDDFLNYGYKSTVTAGTGDALPRWTAALVDAVAECTELKDATEEAAEEATGPLSVVSVTAASKTLGLSDAGTIQACDRATAQAITIPLNASVAFATNDIIFFEALGAGAVTITATAGVTLNDQDGGSVTLSAAVSGGYIRKNGTNDWVAVGSFV